MSKLKSDPNRPPLRLAIFLLIFTILVIAAFLVYYFAQVARTRQVYSDQLSTLAELKASQINLWRTERLVDADRILSDPVVGSYILTYFESPDDLVKKSELNTWLKSLLRNPNYLAVFFCDSSGEKILQVNDDNNHPGYFSQDVVLESIREKKIVLSDLNLTPTNKVYMDLAVPIFENYQLSTNNLLGIVVLQIDPEYFLFPLLESVPATNNSTETLLVRRDGDQVVYISRLKYLNNNPLKLGFPISNTNLPAVKAVDGETGIVTGKDYRNTEVTVYITPIKETNWKLLAKIDQSEIYSPLQSQGLMMGFSLALVVLAIGIGIDFLWRQQSEKYYQGLHHRDVERSKAENRYSNIFNFANDIILIVNEFGKIIDANERASKVYGYSHEELLEMTVADLRDPALKNSVAGDMLAIKENKINHFETIQQTKSGQKIMVEISSRFVKFEDNPYYLSIIRDITERKKSEEQLRQSELALRKAQQVSKIASWSWNSVTQTSYWSDEIYTIFGLDPQKTIPSNSILTKEYTHPDDYEKIIERINEGIRIKKNFSVEYRIIRPDGEIRNLWADVGEMIFDENDKLLSIFGIIQDITEKKNVERELRQRESLLSKIFEILPIGLGILDNNGTMTRVNQAIKNIWGLDISQNREWVPRGLRLPDRIPVQIDDWASDRAIKDGKTTIDEMLEIKTFTGQTKTIMNYAIPIYGEEKEIKGAIFANLDITGLKKVEDQLKDQLDELRRWNVATLGREKRVLELKKEINNLLKELGKKPKYSSVEEKKDE